MCSIAAQLSSARRDRGLVTSLHLLWKASSMRLLVSGTWHRFIRGGSRVFSAETFSTSSEPMRSYAAFMRWITSSVRVLMSSGLRSHLGAPPLGNAPTGDLATAILQSHLEGIGTEPSCRPTVPLSFCPISSSSSGGGDGGGARRTNSRTTTTTTSTSTTTTTTMATEKRLAFSIVQFLRDQAQGGRLNSDEQESLEVSQPLPEIFLNSLLKNDNMPEPETSPPPKDIERAEQLKNDGNNHMKEENYSRAMECYSEAIELDLRNAVAAAHSKLGNYAEATGDCERAIGIDPDTARPTDAWDWP
ncbi:hypothetical protein CRUP_025399 [Coryphaenoides rupestris]|nr:hypothetical protein CRUP_025399 [Coryphaenoides rupestris]